jgi:hypothetical protein
MSERTRVPQRLRDCLSGVFQINDQAVEVAELGWRGIYPIRNRYFFVTNGERVGIVSLGWLGGWSLTEVFAEDIRSSNISKPSLFYFVVGFCFGFFLDYRNWYDWYQWGTLWMAGTPMVEIAMELLRVFVISLMFGVVADRCLSKPFILLSASDGSAVKGFGNHKNFGALMDVFVHTGGLERRRRLIASGRWRRRSLGRVQLQSRLGGWALA